MKLTLSVFVLLVASVHAVPISKPSQPELKLEQPVIVGSSSFDQKDKSQATIHLDQRSSVVIPHTAQPVSSGKVGSVEAPVATPVQSEKQSVVVPSQRVISEKPSEVLTARNDVPVIVTPAVLAIESVNANPIPVQVQPITVQQASVKIAPVPVQPVPVQPEPIQPVVALPVQQIQVQQPIVAVQEQVVKSESVIPSQVSSSVAQPAAQSVEVVKNEPKPVSSEPQVLSSKTPLELRSSVSLPEIASVKVETVPAPVPIAVEKKESRSIDISETSVISPVVALASSSAAQKVQKEIQAAAPVVKSEETLEGKAVVLVPEVSKLAEVQQIETKVEIPTASLEARQSEILQKSVIAESVAPELAQPVIAQTVAQPIPVEVAQPIAVQVSESSFVPVSEPVALAQPIPLEVSQPIASEVVRSTSDKLEQPIAPKQAESISQPKIEQSILVVQPIVSQPTTEQKSVETKQNIPQ